MREEDILATLENREVGDLEIETLAGDIRDHVLGLFKTLQAPWPMLKEHQQREVVEGTGKFARDLVRDVCSLVTDHGFPRVVVQVGDLKISGGGKPMEAKIFAPLIPDNLEVMKDLPGMNVALICIDSSGFMGDRGPADVDPDEPELLPEAKAPAKKPRKAKPAEATLGGVPLVTPAHKDLLRKMAALEDGAAEPVAPFDLGPLLELGLLSQVVPPEDGLPGRYRITLAGRHAVAEDPAQPEPEGDALQKIFDRMDANASAAKSAKSPGSGSVDSAA